jgi:aryl-alcohol dehydrogenase-like predicted oxidoreductase
MIKNMTRKLGRSGIEVSALGLGCWAIGGIWNFLGTPAGWSKVDDAESIRAIQKAIESGINFFDTAANYGAGHSEKILGEAIKGKRDKIIICTKFGYNVDETHKEVFTYGQSEEDSDIASYIRGDLEKSLKRLRTDYIDVYLLHIWGLKLELALKAREVLDTLVNEGKIRTYGWSTDRTDAIKEFASSQNCSVVMQALNILDGNLELLSLCENLNLASINRSPLGMGILTGKFTENTRFSNDDVRKHAVWFSGLKDGHPNKDWIDALDAVKEILKSKGRTLTQGALAWIWGKSQNTIPMPGFKTVIQVEENTKAMEFGPLTPEQMNEIESILKRS